MTNVAFRVDASLDIGSGHVMRCLTLASQLEKQGWRCRFYCRNHPGSLLDVIQSRGFAAYELPAPSVRLDNWLGSHWQEDARQLQAFLEGEPVDWLVVDHYGIDASWEDELKRCVGGLMVIDDLANRPHSCDVLLDQNLGRKAADYEALVPPQCRLLIGLRYVLLRDQFYAARNFSLSRRAGGRLQRLLVTMGGMDRDNVTESVLEALRGSALPADCSITVVMGKKAPWLENVRRLASSLPWVCEIVTDVEDMASLMSASDLAIGAAGSTAWERCYLGLPSIVAVLAENQRAAADNLAEAGAAIRLDLDREMPGRLRTIIRRLLDEPRVMTSLANTAAAIAGEGVGRQEACGALLELTEMKRGAQ